MACIKKIISTISDQKMRMKKGDIQQTSFVFLDFMQCALSGVGVKCRSTRVNPRRNHWARSERNCSRQQRQKRHKQSAYHCLGGGGDASFSRGRTWFIDIVLFGMAVRTRHCGAMEKTFQWKVQLHYSVLFLKFPTGILQLHTWHSRVADCWDCSNEGSTLTSQ